jgi:hypothetical protein
MDEGEKPILDQCVQGAQDTDGIPGAVGVQGPAGDLGAPGVTGPGGYVQLGNIIQQWGTSTADAVGGDCDVPRSLRVRAIRRSYRRGQHRLREANANRRDHHVAIRTPDRELAGAGLLTAPRRLRHGPRVRGGRHHTLEAPLLALGRTVARPAAARKKIKRLWY